MSIYNKSEINKQLVAACIESENILDLKDIFDKVLIEYDLNKTKVASILNIDRDILDDLLSGNTRHPTMLNVIKIADFLEISLNEAVKAILRRHGSEHEDAIDRAKNATFIAKHFDIKRLSKAGFFEDPDNHMQLEDRVLRFFDYYTLHQYESLLDPSVIRIPKRSVTDKMKDFWVKSAQRCFKAIDNPNRYSEEELQGLLSRIKPFCQDEKAGLFAACKALYKIGVTVIFQNQLSGTQLGPGTFIVDGKPCILLTDHPGRYAGIWWALIHELNHVLNDLEKISESGYHLSGEPDLLGIEENATDFACEYFCGFDSYAHIAPGIDVPFRVKKFAKDLQVHPCFVYFAYQYFQDKLHGRNHRKEFQKYSPDHTAAVKPLLPITWREDSLIDIAKSIRQGYESNNG